MRGAVIGVATVAFVSSGIAIAEAAQAADPIMMIAFLLTAAGSLWLLSSYIDG